MSVPISFTEKDLLRGKVVDPGWYVVRVEGIGAWTPSKDGGSQNSNVEVVIVKAESGDETFKGVPLDWNFNSKAIGFAVGFLAGFGVEVTPGQRFDLESAVGKELLIFVENDNWQGRTVNRVNHKYKPISA